uniref:Uncharacterized protein n=1 Tax=Arundo donax TaxID=35708 RepID=A0A0A8ZYU9_ARUDO
MTSALASSPPWSAAFESHTGVKRGRTLADSGPNLPEARARPRHQQ